MGLYYDLPVFRDTYGLVLLLFRLTAQFPREYRFTLGQDLKRDGLSLVRSIYRANRAIDKRVYQDEFLDVFELVKLEVRLCSDLRLLSLKAYSDVSFLMDRIGRQMTAWRKSGGRRQAGTPYATGYGGEPGFGRKGGGGAWRHTGSGHGCWGGSTSGGGGCSGFPGGTGRSSPMRSGEDGDSTWTKNRRETHRYPPVMIRTISGTSRSR